MRPIKPVVAAVLFFAAIATLFFWSDRHLQQAVAQEVRFSSSTTILDGGTNNVAGLATNTYSLRIDVPRSTAFVLSVSAKPRGSLSNIVALDLVLRPSLDGSTVANAAPFQTYTLTGTTNASGLVIGVTNVTANAPYYFLTAVGNTEGIAATNLTVSYGERIAR